MKKLEHKNCIEKRIIGEKWIIYKIINVHCGWIYTLSFNYTHKMFATGSSDNIVRLWSLKSFKNLANFFGHVGAIKCVVFDEKHNSIFSGGDDLVIKYWDIEYNKNVRNYKGHISSIVKLIKYPSLNIILSGSRDNTVRLWDFRIRKEIMILLGHKNTVTCLLSNSEKPHIISGSLDNTIRFWDLVANKSTLILKNFQNGLKEMHHIGKNGGFSALSSDSLNFYSKNGLLLRKMVNLVNSYDSFSVNQNNDLMIGYSSGWIRYINFGSRNNSYFFRLFDKNQHNKMEEKSSSIGFNQKGDQLLTVGIRNTIKVFSKRWFFLSKNKECF
nr:prl1-like protein [Cryptomonas sp.]